AVEEMRGGDGRLMQADATRGGVVPNADREGAVQAFQPLSRNCHFHSSASSVSAAASTRDSNRHSSAPTLIRASPPVGCVHSVHTAFFSPWRSPPPSPASLARPSHSGI